MTADLVDLTERRIARNLDRLRALTRRPGLAARLAAHLHTEEPMDRQPVNLRIDAPTLARAEALVEPMKANPQFSAIARASRAAVLRLAMLEGLAVLERRYSKRKTEGEGEA